jgi:hypothetical protein
MCEEGPKAVKPLPKEFLVAVYPKNVNVNGMFLDFLQALWAAAILDGIDSYSCVSDFPTDSDVFEGDDLSVHAVAF